jgi:hypothetical protein
MSQSLPRAVALVVAGAVAGVAIWQWRAVPPQPPDAHPAPRAGVAASALESQRRGAAGVAGRLRAFESRLAREAAQRRALEEQIAALRDEVASLRAGLGADVAPGAAKTDRDAGRDSAAAERSDVRDTATASEHTAAAADLARSPTERALIAAGVDVAVAADIKRRGDELALSEMYLRDQAERENWLNTPRFTEELAAIRSQQTSIRDEIGETAYDGYLFALGRPNRVIVEDVLSQSVAEDVGLRPGDLILRYGEARIFHGEDLIEQTRSGIAGANVRLDILRNGERLAIDVPRGPLGVRIGAAQDYPEAG